MKRLWVLGVLSVLVVLGVMQLERPADPIVLPTDANQKLLAAHIVDSIVARKQFVPQATPRAQGRAILVVSISDGFKAAKTVTGRGDDWNQAALAALKAVTPEVANSAKWIKIDFVSKILTPKILKKQFHKTRMSERPSLLGLAPLGMEGPLFIPEIVQTRAMISSKMRLMPVNLARELDESQVKLFKLRKNIARFRTSSYAWIEGTVYKLFRGSRIQKKSIGKNLISESLDLAESYLLKEMRGDGSYTYIYKPISNLESSRYNILRHAGTTWSLLQL